MPRTFPVEWILKPPQFQLSGDHCGKALEHMQFIGAHAASGLAAKDGEGPEEFAIGRVDGRSGKETCVEEPEQQLRPTRCGDSREIPNHDGTIGCEHHLEDRVLAGKLAKVGAPKRLDPYAARVAEAKACGVGVEVFGSQ